MTGGQNRVHHEVSAMLRALLSRGWELDRWTRHGLLLRYPPTGGTVVLPKTPGNTRWKKKVEKDVAAVEVGGVALIVRRGKKH